MARLLFLAPIFALAAVTVYYLFLKSPPPLPDMDLNAWWGPESLKSKQDEEVRSFRIKFKESMIQDLKQYFKLTRKFQPPLEGVAFEYGFNSNELNQWLKYWSEEYNFEARQKFLNQFSHFRTYVQGLSIHFIHVRPEVSPGVEVVPVLMLHGWPGSVREFYEAIPYLTAVQEGRDFAVEVIVPSLPGYGFSDAAVRPGLGAAEMAVIFRNLMQKLGYKQYYIQGGDWGSLIGSNMATLFPKEVLGFHTNLAMTMTSKATLLEFLGSFYPALIVDKGLEDRLYPLSDRFSFLAEETGYFHIQATKPDTVGLALSDSPAGLLAYILEKFCSWTNRDYRSLPDGGLTKYFTKEQLIDNVMMYWSTNSITTSVRLYSETFNKRHFGLNLEQIPTPVLTWATQAKHEVSYQPPFILKYKYPNLVNVTVLEDGGHFLAFQLPKVFAEDVLRALVAFRKINKNPKTEL